MNSCSVSPEELDRTATRLKSVLNKYRIKFDDVKWAAGPAVSLYKVFLSKGEKYSKLRSMAVDIKASLHRRGFRITALEDSVGIEIANESGACVKQKVLLDHKAFRESSAKLPVALGLSFGPMPKVIDLVDAPHILVAGATQQGKSACLHSMVASLLYSKRPDELKLVFIDPKDWEFKAYRKLSGSATVVTKTADTVDVLDGLCTEMVRRCATSEKQPFIVCFIDEFADLTVPFPRNREAKERSRRIISDIILLADKGRDAGIHLVISTQKPTKDVIPVSIKANVPTRIAFRTASRTDSMAILDAPGAESLIGKGDMLFGQGTELERIQSGYLNPEEIKALVDSINAQKGGPFSQPLFLTPTSPGF